MQRAPGMVLVGYGRAEERHDSVAGELVYGALPAVHGVEHELEGAVHDGVELLGVEGARQLGRTLDVYEQDGDLLALAAEGAPFFENALGEMLRRVGGGSAGSGAGLGRGRSYRGTAVVAEARARAKALAARRAARLDGTAAGVAEAGGLAVVMAAGRAGHGPATRPRGPPARPG